LAWPYARCNACFGKGHGEARGSGSAQSQKRKKLFGVHGIGGELSRDKEARMLQIVMATNRAQDRRALFYQLGRIGEGCTSNHTTWDNMEVNTVPMLRKHVVNLKVECKRRLRPAAFAPGMARPVRGPATNGLGVPEINVNGSTTSTYDLRMHHAALESPSLTQALSGSPMTCGIYALDHRGSCD